jgi:membrane protein YdbS with pleckstrin-like domain
MAKFCPECANPIIDNSIPFCPKCGYDYGKIISIPNIQSINSVQAIQQDTNLEQIESADSVPLTTNPDKMSFIFKYGMALSACILVVVAIIVQLVINNMIREISPELSDVITLIFFIGILLIFIIIGWAMKLTEMWISMALTLGLSGLVGIPVAFFLASQTGQPQFLLSLVQWIAFLIQPFSVIAAIIVIAWTERFRRSIQYTITQDGVWIKGGVYKKQERMIPLIKIGMIEMEQDYFGIRYNYGTIIAHSSTRMGSEMSGREAGCEAKSSREESRNPLYCLYGIPNPQNAKQILTRLISRPARREEEQVSSPDKIYNVI